MKLLLTFTRSLLLAAMASFLAPMVLLGAAWFGMHLWTYLPGVGGLGLVVNRHLSGFLMVFGDGSPCQGVLTISIVCALVGSMFDTYAFYNFQTQRNISNI